MWLFFGISSLRKIRDLVLEKKWSRNYINEENDPYKTPILAYNREMDQLVMANKVNNTMGKR
jgi:hypothetical protein